MRPLDDHVRRSNEGVAQRRLWADGGGVADDGELHFEGMPVGPFIGREAIAAAYRDQPPDDEIEILGTAERDGMVVARYAWLRDHGKQAGKMRLTPQDGRIKKLVVTFG